MDKVSINMTLAANLRAAAIEAGRGGGREGGREGARECPVELIAPCAVPSASLKDKGALREEGLVVPSSFLVGDVVDFITRMSKLERYSGISSEGGGREGGRGGEGRCRSLERIFVTDCGRLLGYVTSMDLLVQERTAPLLSIVRPCEVLVKETDEYDDAILAMRRKRLTYAPVVTEEEVVVGIITPSDMLNEMELEATDDVSRFSGSGRGSESFFGTPVLQVVTARASWLVSLLMLQSLSSIILTHFSALIERHLVIALFLTMLTGTAGNAGNQSSAMVIRGIATGEINRKNSWRVVWREVKAALLMSVLLAGAAFVRVYITPGSTLMSTVSVTLALSVTVVGACAFGTVAPLVMDRLGIDPANCASPALSTIVDVGGVLVLCAISSVLLG
jgi:magnesium transporter